MKGMKDMKAWGKNFMGFMNFMVNHSVFFSPARGGVAKPCGD
jgi:hypothetical protein